MAEADPGRTMITITEAAVDLDALVDRAHGGEVIILSQNGVPVARLMAYEPDRSRPRTPGRFRAELAGVTEQAVMEPCFSAEEIEAFEGAPSSDRR